MAVDRSFILPGHGPTITGTVLSGTAAVGDRFIVSPIGIEARVRSIHADNRPVERAFAGERCALVLGGAGIGKESVRRGDMVVDPALHAPTSRIDVRLRVLPSESKAIGQWFPVTVHHAAAHTPARVVVLSERALQPGDTGFAQLVLKRPLAAGAGDRFVLRDTSARRTIGGGTIVDVHAPERKRRTPERLDRLEALAEADPGTALVRALRRENGWIDFEGFVRDRSLGAEAAGELVARLGIVRLGSSAAMSGEGFARLRGRIAEALDAFHGAHPDLPGIGMEQLRKALPPILPPDVFIAAATKLAEAGEVALDRMWVRSPFHRVAFTPDEEERLLSIIALLDAEPYRPPRVRDIAKTLAADEKDVRRLLHMAAKRGEVVEIAHDHFFTRCAVEKLALTAAAVASDAPAGFTAADFRDRLHNGRKVAIQILEFFDLHGLTIRRGDTRRINAARLSLFAPRRDGQTAAPSNGGVPLPVGRPDFKSGRDRRTVPGGFDSHPPPPQRCSR